jgi:hypothetical protein
MAKASHPRARTATIAMSRSWIGEVTASPKAPRTMPLARICGAHMRVLAAKSAHRNKVQHKPEAFTMSSTALNCAANRGSPPPYSTVSADSSTTRPTPRSVASESKSLAPPPTARGPKRIASMPRSASASVFGSEASPRTTSVPWGRIEERAAELEVEVAGWLRTAEAADAEEDKLHGHDKTGEEMPKWVPDKQRRIEKIRQAKAELEAEAKAAAEAKRRRRTRQRRNVRPRDAAKADGLRPRLPTCRTPRPRRTSPIRRAAS